MNLVWIVTRIGDPDKMFVFSSRNNAQFFVDTELEGYDSYIDSYVVDDV